MIILASFFEFYFSIIYLFNVCSSKGCHLFRHKFIYLICILNNAANA
jgi:hypothetical protein